MIPRRVQRRRTKGFRLPAGCQVVTRPTQWGNPYGIGTLVDATNPRSKLWTYETSVAQYRSDLFAGLLEVTVEDVQRELRGRDLACFCALDKPCHADVLLEVANGVLL